MSKEEELYTAVLFKELPKVRQLLDGGADPNYVKTGGSNSTLLHTAVWSGIEMVDLLLQHGADPLKTNLFGERAFHTALQYEKYSDIARRLRELEPPQAHDPVENEALARRFGAPEALISRLSGEDLTLGQKDDGTPLVRLLPLQDIYIFHFLGSEYVALSSTILEQEYSAFYFCGPIVWCGTRRRVCGIDAEHDTTCVVSDWETFVSDTYAVISAASYDDE